MRTILAGIAVSIISFACAPAVAGESGGEHDCDVPGHVVQWQADYCLFLMGTDDLVAAQDCIEHERHRDFRTACEAKRHYRRAWCEATAAAGVRSGTIEACARDPDAMGTVVRQDGL